MNEKIKLIGILGFVLCLFIMYATPHGIRGIQKFDSTFRLLDMQFHYNSKIVKQTFERIHEDGRNAYKKYLLLDYIFIMCFFITMIGITDLFFVSPKVRTILFILCGLRALFDILENTLLLYMLHKYPVFKPNLAAFCSWITTFKFVMLYLWFGIIALQVILLCKSKT